MKKNPKIVTNKGGRTKSSSNNPESVSSIGNIKSSSKDNVKTKKKKDDEEVHQTTFDELEEWMQPKQLIKPENQLELTEEELKEEFTRILTANNPHAPTNIVRFSFKEQQFKQIANVDQLAVHYSIEGNLLHKESDEAKRQMSVGTTFDEGNEDDEEENEENEDKENKEIEETGEKAATGVPTQKVTNQFNFCERASQTYNNPFRERGTMTEPPPRVSFSAMANQWEIYDAYVEDLQRQEKEKEKEAKKPAKKENAKKKKNTSVESTTDDINRVGKSSKIVERMVNQNTYDAIAHDFKYYEDQSDEYRDGEGTVLPLWRFSYERTKRMTVTALNWSPQYQDLFAVGHGSYEFLKQTHGMICFYSLKNPSYPENVYTTASGVMCLDIHPSHAHLFVVGFYDGCVAVYSLEEASNKPIHISTSKNGKHTDPVWEVRWQKDNLDGNINFYSISSDGRVVLWTIIKSELQYTDIIQLNMSTGPLQDNNETPSLSTLGCGTCFDFHKSIEHLFLVGTEEGLIHKCSKAYSSKYLSTFDAHHMTVYSVKWNHYHPKVFISCSADWTVKIWEHTTPTSMFTFDLGSAVGDIAWAPFSSTVFAAVTAEGKVLVYDLSINKYEPVCDQIIMQKGKTKLTHISFNPIHPIVIIGDDRGHATSVKLSPNLRKALNPREQGKGPENEIAKFDKLLALVKEPTEVPNN